MFGKTADVVLSDYHHYPQLMEELTSLADSYVETSRYRTVLYSVQYRRVVQCSTV